MSLDDKLKEIMGEQYEPILNNADEWLPQIKKAFADEGYIKIPQIREVKGKLETQHNFVDINNMRYMSGQEFYERFEKIVSDEIYGDTNPTNKVDCESVPYICTCDMLEAAKKAAGLKND
jgi:hypothetical protein